MPVDHNSVLQSVLSEPEQKRGIDHARIADTLLGVTGGASDDQVIAAEELRSNFDIENFAPSGLRISLSRGDNLDEKNLRIKKVFPEGEVKVVRRSVFSDVESDKPVLVYRESPNEQFKLLEPPGFDLTDIVEAMSPSGESITGEVLAAILTRGGSIPATIGRQVIGALAGEAVEQGVQSARGVQAQTPGQIAGEIGLEGGLSAVGGFAMSPLVGLKNIGRGSGVLQVGKEGEEAVRASGRLGIGDKITPGMVADNPIVEIQERQASALLPALNRRYREIATSLDNAMKANAPPAQMNKAIDSVVSGMDRLRRESVAKLKVTRVKPSSGGLALDQGIASYDSVASKVIDDLYDVARNIEEPNFNYQPIIDVAQDIRAGAKGSPKPKVENLLKELEDIKGPITKSDGTQVSVSQQIRNIRTDAYALKTVKAGEVADTTTGQASDLFKSIDEVLDNPVNTNGEFVKAWRKAGNEASLRFDTLDKLAVIKAAKSQNPLELVSAFAAPGQAGNLVTLRQTVAPEYWKTFTDAFKTDLVRDPTKLSARLKAFDDETINVLIPRSEQVAWKKAATELDRIAATGVDNLAEINVSNKGFISDLITNATERDVETFIKSAKTSRNKGVIESLQAGIFDWAWDGVSETQKSGIKINVGTLQTNVKALQKSGMWDVLTPQQKLVIRDVKLVSKALQTLDDAGTSIRAAQIAPGVLRLKPTALMSLLHSGIVSHFYLSGAGRKIMFGSGVDNSAGAFIRAFGGALAQVSVPEDLSQLEREQNE